MEAYKESGTNVQVLGGIPIISTASYVVSPMIYKTDANGDLLIAGSAEYKNDSVPFEGVYIDYMKQLIGVANGDIAIKYTHRSATADHMYPESAGTAAVQDVADGLLDMAIGPYW
jgi:hypothetical protein